MKRSLRRAVALGAMAVFILSAPLVIFYALGYRAGFQDNLAPQPVGVLSVETTPTRADVTVNGRLIGRSPEIVSGLTPGPVRLSVTKSGYRPWEKELNIEAGRATEVKDIILFPEKLSAAELSRNVALFSLSPNRRLIVYATRDNHVSVINQTGSVVAEPIKMSAPITSLLWSPNDTHILITLSSRAQYLLNVSDPSEARLQSLPLTLTKLVWDPHASGRIIWQSAANTLNAFQVMNAANAELIKDVQDFATSNRHIYAVTTENQLQTYSFQGELTGNQIPDLPGEVRDLHVTPGGRLAVVLTDGSLWIWVGGDWQKISDHAESFSWSPDEQLLMVAPDQYSLYVYNLDAERAGVPLEEMRLVTRLTRVIQNPQWFAGSRHLIYQINDEIWVTEIDTRDHSQAYQLDTTNNGSSQITVGESGKYLYYLRESGSNTVLVSANLITAADSL